MDREKLLDIKNDYERIYLDSLTSTYNRKFFTERMKPILQDTMREERLFTFVLIDLDDFAHYNEMNGIERGDVALQQVGYMLKNNLRSEDLVIRYDADQFLVVLLDAPRKESLFVAERLRKIIEAYPFSGEMIQPTGNLTVSMGLAAYPEDGESIEFLIKRAGTALTHAKERMKNRVEVLEG